MPPGSRMLRGQPVGAVTVRPSWDFQPEQARKTLFDQFGTTTLAGFGIDDRATEVQAAGALMAYLRETQKTVAAATSPGWSPTAAPTPWRSTR